MLRVVGIFKTSRELGHMVLVVLRPGRNTEYQVGMKVFRSIRLAF
jgi:hypothetical protein